MERRRLQREKFRDLQKVSLKYSFSQVLISTCERELLSVVKMLFISKLTYRLNTITVPSDFFFFFFLLEIDNLGLREMQRT